MNTFVGTIVDDRFKISSPLGRGGMGAVFLAHDKKTDRQVAVKFLYGGVATHQLEERFQREYKMMANLSHPNIATLYAGGRDEETSHLWYAMELIDGKSISDLIEEEAPLDYERVKNILEQVATAFIYIHPQGIIHRDITPRNILLTEQGRVVLVDFGLARDLALTAMTASGMVMGTPHYMSPEQFTGDKLDGRSDIYQIGVITFEMLTGKRPFNAKDPVEMAMLVSSKKPPRVSDLRKEVPPQWDEFVDKCLSVDREDRFRDGESLLEAVKELGKRQMRSTLQKTAPENKNTLAIVFSLLVLFAFIFAGYMNGSSTRSTPCKMSDFTYQALPGAIRIKWRTSRPCPSIVTLSTKGHRPLSVRGTKGETAVHHILITGLQDHRGYKAVIALPNNQKSLPQKVKTGKLTLDLIGAHNDPKGLHIEFSAPACVIKRAKLDGSAWKSASFDITNIGKDRFILSLPTAAKSLTGISLEVVLPTGILRYVSVTGLLARQVNVVSSQLCSLVVRDFSEAVGKDGLSMIKAQINEAERNVSPLPPEADRERHNKVQERRRAIVEPIKRELARTKYIEYFKEARRLAPLVFDHQLLPDSGKQRLYKGLMRAARLFIHLDRYLLPVSFTEKLPPMGNFTLQMSAPPGLKKELVVFQNSENPLRLGMVPLLRQKQQHRWQKVFSLPKLPPGTKPAIRVKTTSFKYIAAMIYLNDSHEFLFYDRPLLPYERYVKTTFWQRVPEGALLEGENKILFQFEWVFYDVIGWSLDIEEIAIVW